MLNITCFSLTYNINVHPYTSINDLSVAKKGRPRINGNSWSSSISNITKSNGEMNLSTFTNTSSIISLGYVIDLSASCKVMVVGFTSPSPNFLNNDRDIRLMLVLKSHNALSMVGSPNVHGIVKLLGPSTSERVYFKKLSCTLLSILLSQTPLAFSSLTSLLLEIWHNSALEKL